MEKNENITIDELAVMVQKGFEGTYSKMDAGFKEVNERLDRIENVLIKRHTDEIENLKERMHRLEEALAMK